MVNLASLLPIGSLTSSISSIADASNLQRAAWLHALCNSRILPGAEVDNLRHSSRLGMNSGRRSYSVNTFHTISTGAATVVSAMHLLASCLPWSTILMLIRPSGEAVEVEKEGGWEWVSAIKFVGGSPLG